ncbi:PD40 domain-containing protein [bacterium]|nr:PD40 domain-containing protein [bacterium]
MSKLFVRFMVCAAISCCSIGCQKSTVQSGRGDYLGQKPPGDTPALFAPGLVSTGMDDRDFTIAPDQSEIYYTILERPRYTIVRLRRVNDRWMGPEIAPFSGSYNDYEPQFSPDGTRLYFCSERPASPDDTTADSDIWYVEKKEGEWGRAVNIGAPVNSEFSEFYPSVTADGTLYFTSSTMKIMRAAFHDGVYDEPEALSDSINTRAEYNACIAPDESYMLFTSHSWGYQAGRGDMFMAFRKEDGSWSRPTHLGYEINSMAADMCPSISPDGMYLFFSSNRPIDTEVAEPVRAYRELMDYSRQPGNKKMDIYWVRMPDVLR